MNRIYECCLEIVVKGEDGKLKTYSISENRKAPIFGLDNGDVVIHRTGIRGHGFIGHCRFVKAKKGDKSLWPHEYFKHDFKAGSKAAVYLKNGNIRIQSEIGKRLWKTFDY